KFGGRAATWRLASVIVARLHCHLADNWTPTISSARNCGFITPRLDSFTDRRGTCLPARRLTASRLKHPLPRERSEGWMFYLVVLVAAQMLICPLAALFTSQK